MESNARQFRDALGKFATGICVVTTELPDQGAFGMTINSFSSVSLDPPMILWSLAKSSSYFESLMSADQYSINVLGSDQKPLSSKFAGKDKRLEKEHTDWSQPDFPAIKDALAIFNCEVAHRYEGGDHIIIVGNVLDFKSADAEDPLIFYAGGYHALTANGSNHKHN